MPVGTTTVACRFVPQAVDDLFGFAIPTRPVDLALGGGKSSFGGLAVLYTRPVDAEKKVMQAKCLQKRLSEAENELRVVRHAVPSGPKSRIGINRRISWNHAEHRAPRDPGFCAFMWGHGRMIVPVLYPQAGCLVRPTQGRQFAGLVSLAAAAHSRGGP